MHFSPLFAVAALTGVALSKPASGISAINSGASAQLQKRAGEVITTGAVGLGDDQVHSRLEINDLSSNRPDMWSLYIRAMVRWKDVVSSDETGYYGIAGIHGVPRTSWNGVEQCDGCEGADGYCTHDSVLFPAWHRAYMALYEQEIIKVALEVADSFDGAFGDRLKAAAQKLRIPYWDWAAAPGSGSSTLPASIAGQQVTISGPDGDETVDNPLFSYHFEDPSNMYYSPFTDWTDTMRYPDSNSADATSQDSQAVAVFSNLQENLQDQVYQLLTQCKDYLGFATDDASNNACANSLEGLHNTIHTAAGGAGTDDVSGGHMTYLPLASWDPLFYVHHANVDRLFALWQTANPEQYGASQIAPHSTWTIASGSQQDADSPLMPFRKAADAYWTTNDVKDFEAVFKYSYPEFVVGDQSRATIINYINAIYGSSPSETAASLSARAELTDSTGNESGDLPRGVTDPTQSNSTSNKPAGYGNSGSDSDSDSGIGIGIGPFSISIGLPWSKPTGSATGAYPTITGAWNATKTSGYPAATGTSYPSRPQTPLDPAFMAPNGSVYQYQCNIQTPRYAFNGSYIVYVFDGQPSSNDTSTWLADDSCIGQIGILAGGDMENHGILSSGSVPITRHLQKQYKSGKLSGLSEEVVVPYMKKNLNWKIVYRGEEIHPDTLTGYKASFLSGLLSPLVDGELPSWSNLLPHVDVTKDKAGGITKVVDGLLGGVGDAIGNVGDAVSSTLGGGSSTPTGYGSPQSTGNAPHTTADSPVPHTTAAPVSTYPVEEEVVTVYETKIVTYCPCKESASTAATEQPSATAYAKAY